MKKILSVIALIISVNCFSQDSTKVQISVEARDLEYIAATASFEADEDFFDAVKSKFRVQNPPSGGTLVVVDSIYTIDWLRIYLRLKKDYVAVDQNVAKRVGDILVAVGQNYLTTKKNEIDAEVATLQTSLRIGGRFKLRKKVN